MIINEDSSRQCSSLDVDLTVIIVNWNGRDILRDCLKSVFDNIEKICTEVIVVDNGSTDGSREMIKADFPKTVLIANDDNRGFAAANNQGLRQAKGRHCLLLNNDTIVLGDVLARSVEYLDMNPGVGALGCRVLNPNRTMQLTCFMYPSILNILLLTLGVENLRWPRFCGRRKMLDWDRDTERDVEVITGCYLMVPHKVIQQIGMLDESFFFYGEETDWCRRILCAGLNVRFAPTGEIIHIGNASASKLNAKRDVLLTQALVHFHKKNYGRLSATVAWTILWFFNVSRFLFWAITSSVTGSKKAKSRRKHFGTVVKGFKETWPIPLVQSSL